MTEMPFAPPDQAQPSYRPLRRSQADRKLAGVCGGIGEYFRIDPTLIRVAFLIGLVVTGGTLALAYLVAMIVMPETDAPTWPTQPPVA